MEFFVNFLELLISDMRINLGRGNICMTEHDLNRADIGSIREKISRKGVTQDVRRDFL